MSDKDDREQQLERLVAEFIALTDPDQASRDALDAELADAFAEAGLERPLPDSVRELRETLGEEQDRGCALAGVAYLDFALTEMIQAHMINLPAVVDDLFRPSGPLGSFATRIDLAQLLGLVGNDVARELHLFRKIRNEFAHSPKRLTFEHQSIAARCNELKFVVFEEKLSPRRRFIRAILGILGVIHGTTRTAERPKSAPVINLDTARAEPRIARIIEILNRDTA